MILFTWLAATQADAPVPGKSELPPQDQADRLVLRSSIGG
jgi:hypothetical protein